jgi:hypothetical protein
MYVSKTDRAQSPSPPTYLAYHLFPYYVHVRVSLCSRKWKSLILMTNIKDDIQSVGKK